MEDPREGIRSREKCLSTDCSPYPTISRPLPVDEGGGRDSVGKEWSLLVGGQWRVERQWAQA